MPKKYSNANTHENKSIYMLFTILISAFMIIIPFYRGLFFRINYIPAIIFVGLLFALFMVYKLRDKDYKVFGTYLDISVALLPVAYLISFFFAVNAKDAFDMVLLYSSYFMMYKLTSDLSSKDEKYKEIFINIIIASTFILSFTAMLNIAGIVDINGAFMGKRLFGLYQYANTTASVLGVGLILSLNKLINEKNKKAIVIYQMIFTALISSFVFTLSRGGYLVLAGVLLLNFLLLKARAKLKILLALFISFLSSAMLMYKFYTVAEEGMSAIWIHYLISIIVSAAIIYLIYSFRKRVDLKFSDRAINIVLISVVIFFAGTAALLFSVKEPIEYRIEHNATEEKSLKYKDMYLYELKPDSEYAIEFDVMASLESQNSYGIIVWSYDSGNKYKEILKLFEPSGIGFSHKRVTFTTAKDTERIRILLYNYEANSYTIYKDVVIKDSNDIVVRKMEKLKYVPSAIANRLADINLETESASLRLYFAKDGIKIIKDYLIAGAGGGGWKNLYRQYQSIPYYTTEVHNFFVQYGIEVGIIGMAAFVGLIILLLISMLKSIRASSSYLYVYLAAMLLLLHSTIDFNLSLAAVGYILWMLVGIMGSDKTMSVINKLPHKYICILAIALSFVVFFASSFIYYGIKLGAQGAEASNENKDMNKTISLYEKASKYDRYNGAYRIDLAQIMSNQLKETKKREYYDGIVQQIALIKKYEPFNYQYTPIICSIYLTTGKFMEASALADEKLQNEPMIVQSYIIKVNVNYEIANYYLKNEKVKEAIPYLDKIIEANDQFEKINANLKVPLKLTEDYPKKLEAAQRALEMIKADIKE